MKISFHVDDDLRSKIEAAAEKNGITRSELIRKVCIDYFNVFESGSDEEKMGFGCSEQNPYGGAKDEIIETQNIEILQLREEIESQKEFQNMFSKLISEKDQRIEDMKESISRIEAMSITTTDQIASSKDDRIDDLSRMIEHLQGQAAAHSAALQSALMPASENEDNNMELTEESRPDDDVGMIQKPKWMFWR